MTLQFWLLSMVTSDGTPVSIGAPGQCIVVMYVLSGCMSPLNFVVMMPEVIAGMVICLMAHFFIGELDLPRVYVVDHFVAVHEVNADNVVV